MFTQVDIPGYLAGTWAIDIANSEVSFTVRQLGIINTRGRFTGFEGTITTAENPLDSSVRAVINTATVNTKNKRRDKHLNHDDFLNTEQYPTITFTSTGMRTEGDSVLVDGELTIRAVTKQVTLNLELDGFDAGADGKPLARFSAYTEIDRTEYGVTAGRSAPFVGDNIKIILKIVASLQG